jgi:NACalpha-BTF3-like transcription factor
MSRDQKMNMKEDTGSKGPLAVRQATAEQEALLQATIKATQEAEMTAMMAQFQKEQALSKVKIDKADVAFLATQFDLSAAVAERELRLNGGDFHKATAALMGSSA